MKSCFRFLLTPCGGRVQDEDIDAGVSNLKSTVETLHQVLSDVPIPGLSQALQVAATLLDRVAKMRTNAKEKNDVIESIDSLLGSLQASIQEFTPQLQEMNSAERKEARKRLRHSIALQNRVQGLINALETILASVKNVSHLHWYSRLWYAEQDAEELRSIQRKITGATQQFQIQDRITVQTLLNDIKLHAQEAVAALRSIERAQAAHQMRMQQLESRGRIERRQRRRHEDGQRPAHQPNERINREQRHSDDRDILEELRPVDASYRSFLNDEKARLQKGTRGRVLQDIFDWIKDPQQNQRMHVLHGPAGMGKSAILHAVTRQLDNDCLGASFFFNRGDKELSDAHRLFPTLVYQLAHISQELKSLIADATTTYLPLGHSQAINYQAQRLLVEPLRRLRASPPLLLLVVDGVDECADVPEGVVASMLHLLCQAAHQIPFLRILVATRPESHIMDALRCCQHSGCIVFRDLLRDDAHQDILLFIKAELRKCAPFPLLEQRPDAAERLAFLSDGLFIYASTIARYLVRNKYYAVEIYDALLRSQGSMKDSVKIHNRLDMLYITILTHGFRTDVDDQRRMTHIHEVLTWIALAKTYVTPRDLQYVGIPTAAALHTIDRLRSVLLVEDPINICTLIQPCHASFPQFLLDNRRCTEPLYHVASASGHNSIAASLLEFLSRNHSDEESGNSAGIETIRTYALRHWVTHLLASGEDKLSQLPILDSVRTRIFRSLLDFLSTDCSHQGEPETNFEAPARVKLYIEMLYRTLLEVNIVKHYGANANDMVHIGTITTWIALVSEDFTPRDLQMFGVPLALSCDVLTRLGLALCFGQDQLVTPETLIRPRHPTLSSFLRDKTNGTIHISEIQGHGQIASSLIRVLIQSYSRLPLEDLVSDRLRKYACDKWIFHLSNSSPGYQIGTDVLSEIDELYRTALEYTFGKRGGRTDGTATTTHMHHVLSWVALSEASFSMHDLHTAGIPQEACNELIKRLDIVFDFDPGAHRGNRIIRLRMAGFRDFLVDGARCRDISLLVSRPHGHGVIAAGLLNLINKLSGGHMAKYAEKNWVSHLCLSHPTRELCQSLRRCLENNLARHTLLSSAGLSGLSQVNEWCSGQNLDEELTKSIDNAMRELGFESQNSRARKS